jgi:Mn-containing catalase
MPIDGGDGLATVQLQSDQRAALDQMMARNQSDPSADPVTGADLGAGPGAGRTREVDRVL